MKNDDRINYDVTRLAEWVNHPENDGLLSYTERIMVAEASGINNRRPASMRCMGDTSFKGKARAELDDHQLAVLTRYIGMDCKAKLEAASAKAPATYIMQALETIHKSAMPTEEKRRRLFEVQQAVGYYMEFLL